MNNKNQRLQKKRKVEVKKVESERHFKTLRLRTTEEIRRNGIAGRITEDQKALNEVLFEYLVKFKMSLPDGKNVLECC